MYATGMRNGTSLAEVMVAVLIMVIVIIGSSVLFVAGRSQVSMQERNRVATELAAQKLEELKAGGYNDIVEGESEELKCQLEGQPAYNVTDGNVWDVVFNVVDNRVQIDLRGSDGNLQTRFVKTVMMRNYVK